MNHLFRADPILIAAAVLPAILLLLQINRADRLDREPVGLLLWLVFWGAVATTLAGYTEGLGIILLDKLWPEESQVYQRLFYFVVVGLSEEGIKYAFLYRHTWHSPAFNCQFDGVVYAVAVSLGFALWENIDYVARYGFGTALLRAVTAVPGHACFGVFMGAFYGMARRYAVRGRAGLSKFFRVLSVAVPMGIHGMYDSIAMSNREGAIWGFAAFVLGLFLVTSALVSRLSQRDRYV